MSLLRALVAICLLIASSACGWSQTRLHRDWGGVTTQVGNVTISARLSGRVRTSVRVGRSTFHDSNFGVTGLSYRSHTGHLNALWNVRRKRSFVWFVPDRLREPANSVEPWADLGIRTSALPPAPSPYFDRTLGRPRWGAR